VSIPNSKGITLNGNGASITRGSLSSGGALIALSPHSSSSTRITGFTFSDSKSAVGYFITIGSGNEFHLQLTGTKDAPILINTAENAGSLVGDVKVETAVGRVSIAGTQITASGDISVKGSVSSGRARCLSSGFAGFSGEPCLA